MFAVYLEEISKDAISAGNLQFLKNYNKIGRRRVQNTGKNNINMLHVDACKILRRTKKRILKSLLEAISSNEPCRRRSVPH